eukprot:gnl/MRDRNA2_/MRDRNA2_77400_c0_seq2.p1 gnl/MRDRNA2_/MRDRNA2_77400_c0~~gnl/MRDRNA2_/MRDRNA2_77400_c0_seq2.p1  ORF type:complete len:369 (+),score=85.52 gnl/MRDRNA2_/MRDRNA2_77400_c0_seq2:133-1239(+)
MWWACTCKPCDSTKSADKAYEDPSTMESVPVAGPDRDCADPDCAESAEEEDPAIAHNAKMEQLAQKQKERERREAEAAARRKQQKAEMEKKQKAIRDQAHEEWLKTQQDKEFQTAVSVYVGRWVLAKPRPAHKKDKRSRSLTPDVGAEMAEISTDGSVELLQGQDSAKSTLKCQPGGIVSVPLANGEMRTACIIRDHMDILDPGTHGKTLPYKEESSQDNSVSRATVRKAKFEAPKGHTLDHDNGDEFLQRLKWDDGEVWARKGPELAMYNGSWSRATEDADGTLHDLTDMGDIKNGVLTWHGRYGNHHPPVKLDYHPGGYLQSDLDGHPHWVILENDPSNPGTQRLRWSDGDLWFRDDEHKGAEHVE